MDPRLAEFNDVIQGPDYIDLAGGKLKISFHRTVRVSDDDNISNMPPTFGPFPIYPVSKFYNMPAEIKMKKGYFIPMYTYEALSIHFVATHAFAVKIYVGGINAISGGRQAESPDEMYARQSTDPQQDYIVLPQQQWLDGIALPGGVTRQFVAVPSASGYSVGTQLRGSKGNFSALAFEVIPSKDVISRPITLASFEVTVVCLTVMRKEIPIYVTRETSVWELKTMIEHQEGIPPEAQRLILSDPGGPTSYHMDEDKARLVQYGIEAKSRVILVLRLRGGGYDRAPKKIRYILHKYEMGLGAGGRIRQRVSDIFLDPYNPDIWDIDRIAFFNVNILDSKDFRRITNHVAPVSPISAAAKSPVNAADYAKLGLDYFTEAKEVVEGEIQTEEEAQQASEDSTTRNHGQDAEKWKSLKSLCEMGVLSEPSLNSSTSVLVNGFRQFEPAVLVLARARAMRSLSDENAKRPDSVFEGMKESEREKSNNQILESTLNNTDPMPPPEPEGKRRAILSRFKSWLSRRTSAK